MGDIESYRAAKATYDQLKVSRPEIIQQMKTLIDEYVSLLNEVCGKQAGRDILPMCDSFKKHCGDKASAVFGILLRDHLTADDWEMGEETDGSEKVKVYSRP